MEYIYGQGLTTSEVVEVSGPKGVMHIAEKDFSITIFGPPLGCLIFRPLKKKVVRREPVVSVKNGEAIVGRPHLSHFLRKLVVHFCLP